MCIPKVSIVLPCFNVSSCLKRCVTSIIANDYKNFEIILVNDGSTDKTKEIIAELQKSDTRIRAFTQQNSGVSAARNLGIRKAKGEYLLFADPDDEVHEDLISTVIRKMEETQSDYCTFDFDLIGDSNLNTYMNTVLNEEYNLCSNEEIVRVFFPTLFGYSIQDIKNMYHGYPINKAKEFGSVWHCAYKRAVIEDNQILMDESIVLNEDSMFNCEYMLYATKLVSINRPLYKYYLNPQGAMTSNAHNRKLIENKYNLLKKREIIALKYKEKGYGDASDLFVGSCVLSIIEMMLQCINDTEAPKESYSIIKRYYKEPTVQNAIRKFPLGHRLKVMIPVLFLKIHFFDILYLLLKTAHLMGVDISL